MTMEGHLSTSPTSTLDKRILTGLSMCCALLVLLIPIKTLFIAYDEGEVVFNAIRIMNGEVPNRDFWTAYPFGQFYILSALFTAFGPTLLVARLYDIIIRFAIAISLYLIARKLMSHALALLMLMATALFLSSAGFYGYPVFPAFELGLLSILSSFHYRDKHPARWGLLSGIFAGLASLFRWDISLYAAVSVVLTMPFFSLFGAVPENRSGAQKLLAAFKVVIAILVGITIIVLPFYISFGAIAGFNRIWEELVIFPVTRLREMRWLPYPDPIFLSLPTELSASAFEETYLEFLSWLRFYFPIITFATAFLFCGYHLCIRRENFPKTNYFRVVVVGLFGALLFKQALSRYDYVHVMPSLLISFLVAGSLVNCLSAKLTKVGERFWQVFFITIAGLLLLRPVESIIFHARWFPPWGCYSGLSRAGCVLLPGDQERAVRFVISHTQENEMIFVGNERHDLIFVNDIGFYFLARRPSPTPYHHLHPGVATTLPVQKKIIDNIISGNVNLIVLANLFANSEPNAAFVSSGVNILDDFIRTNYQVIAKFGRYEVRQKKLLKRPG
jgi:hypothetical protein